MYQSSQYRQPTEDAHQPLTKQLEDERAMITLMTDKILVDMRSTVSHFASKLDFIIKGIMGDNLIISSIQEVESLPFYCYISQKLCLFLKELKKLLDSGLDQFLRELKTSMKIYSEGRLEDPDHSNNAQYYTHRSKQGDGGQNELENPNVYVKALENLVDNFLSRKPLETAGRFSRGGDGGSPVTEARDGLSGPSFERGGVLKPDYKSELKQATERYLSPRTPRKEYEGHHKHHTVGVVVKDVDRSPQNRKISSHSKNEIFGNFSQEQTLSKPENGDFVGAQLPTISVSRGLHAETDSPIEFRTREEGGNSTCRELIEDIIKAKGNTARNLMTFEQLMSFKKMKIRLKGEKSKNSKMLKN